MTERERERERARYTYRDHDGYREHLLGQPTSVGKLFQSNIIRMVWGCSVKIPPSNLIDIS